MNFIRSKTSPGGLAEFVFHLSKRDRNLLLSVLKLFPVTDLKSHRLSKNSAAAMKANQELLIEGMADHRQKLERLLQQPGKLFRDAEDALELVLNGEQIEWLLQALNDIRVGSWTRLGCPEMDEARRAVLNEESAVHYTAMELSGYFQAVLLQAFRE